MNRLLLHEGSSFNFLTKERERIVWKPSHASLLCLLGTLVALPIIHTIRLRKHYVVCSETTVCYCSTGKFPPLCLVVSPVQSILFANIQCISLLIHLILIKASKGLPSGKSLSNHQMMSWCLKPTYFPLMHKLASNGSYVVKVSADTMFIWKKAESYGKWLALQLSERVIHFGQLYLGSINLAWGLFLPTSFVCLAVAYF